MRRCTGILDTVQSELSTSKGGVNRDKLVLPAEKRPYCHNIHFCSKETLDCLFRGTDDRLVLIEAGVENNGDSRFHKKMCDQLIEKWIVALTHRLQAPGIVDVIDSAKSTPPFASYLVDMKHER